MTQPSSRMLHLVRGSLRLADVSRERTTPCSALIPINIEFASSRKHRSANSQTALLLSSRGTRPPFRGRTPATKAGGEKPATRSNSLVSRVEQSRKRLVQRANPAHGPSESNRPCVRRVGRAINPKASSHGTSIGNGCGWIARPNPGPRSRPDHSLEFALPVRLLLPQRRRGTRPGVWLSTIALERLGMGARAWGVKEWKEWAARPLGRLNMPKDFS